ncbi:hypothetical protein PINS_up021348 [Pythium insidiosum]|nr:hypothetical protein PINS_up021348 [Pythium insidiosum]
MTPENVWLDENGKGGLKVPQGKSERSIICYVGGVSGFVPGARLIIRGSNALKDSDYHTNMNAAVLTNWLEKKVFPAIPFGSVVVIDRASYHITLTEETKPAKSTFRKDAFAAWLVNHGVVVDGQRSKEAFHGADKSGLQASARATNLRLCSKRLWSRRSLDVTCSYSLSATSS